MALYDEGVTSESPTETAAPPAVDPSSAGTQNTEQPGQPRQGNWLPQDRAEEMAQRRAERAVAQAREQFSQEMATERERMQAFFAQQSQTDRRQWAQALQQRANTPSRTPEQEAERQRAQGALFELAPMLQHVPVLAQSHIDTRKQMDDLRAELAEQRAQITDARFQAHASRESGRLQQMATAAGQTFQSPQHLAEFEEQVASVIRSNPQAHAAFQAGDARVMPWALGIASQQRTAWQQSARAALAQTKTTTGQLPPRPGGGMPGSAPALPKFDPANPDAFEKQLFAKARGFLTERMGAP